MNTVAIDRNTLNDLFDNQKKMDELFDSIFDDENDFIRGSSSSSSSSQVESCYPTIGIESQVLYEGGSVKDTLLPVRKRNPYFFVVPVVLEIAAIYLVIAKLL